VVRRNHGVEFAPHRTYEHRVGGKRPRDSRCARRRREQSVVLIAEPAAVAGVRIESTEGESRVINGEPLLQAAPRHLRGVHNPVERQPLADLAQRNMGRGKYDAELV